MEKHQHKLLEGEILQDDILISLSHLCRASSLPAEIILEMVEYGIIEPNDDSKSQSQFSSTSIHRARCAQRLKTDLGVNTAGAALAVELLEELQELRKRLKHMEDLFL